MLREMRDVFIPIALSVLVFHSLAPLVPAGRWRVPRTIAAILVMA